jgi:opacity protein-like surface antigen
MKRILGGAVVAAALFGSAFAADLPSRTYAKAPAMAAPAYNWSGWYGGIRVGLGIWQREQRCKYCFNQYGSRQRGGYGPWRNEYGRYIERLYRRRPVRI